VRNRGAELLFGYTAEEAVGRPVTILIPLDRYDEEPAILERVRRGESLNHYETIRQRKDGSLVNISLTVSPIKNEKGEIVAASKIARDITESKRTLQRQELLIREMDHRIKNLFALAISVLSLSGRSATSVPQLKTLRSILRGGLLAISGSVRCLPDNPNSTGLQTAFSNKPCRCPRPHIYLLQRAVAGRLGSRWTRGECNPYSAVKVFGRIASIEIRQSRHNAEQRVRQ
jgi:PAS domain S-box-containing protein